MRYILIAILILLPSCSSAVEKYHGVCRDVKPEEVTIVAGFTEEQMHARFMLGCVQGLAHFIKVNHADAQMLDHCLVILQYLKDPNDPFSKMQYDDKFRSKIEEGYLKL